MGIIGRIWKAHYSIIYVTSQEYNCVEISKLALNLLTGNYVAAVLQFEGLLEVAKGFIYLHVSNLLS